ncbi:alpha-glycosidase [Paraliobacillus salinarum]|uniref:alpha-glycosidase n=1 Tax=Paraliobacillus salinarum TaxID=1158996 RepID=UPI0015F64027|nr:alpha-glycosidase [Paraliobacillus salinarum]
MFMESIYHRAISPFVYNYQNGELNIMLQTKRDDLKKVSLIYGDPYKFDGDNWVCDIIPMEKTGATDLHDFWKITITPRYRRLRYGFYCQGLMEDQVYYTEKGYFEEMPQDIGNYFCFPFIHQNDSFQAPEWVKDTVWYQIFPERFANGDHSINPENTLDWGKEQPTPENFFGGDFQGIINHLDHLQELGITGIYLCPIFKAYSNHKYDTIDYMEIDPQFGDKETFRELVKQCHDRGIRVMLDAVFNHSGLYFEPFQDVLGKGEQSNYRNWFHIWDFPIQTEPAPNYDTFAFVGSMPKLNTTNPEVKAYLLDVARYWIEEFNIDGWRLDVANEIDHNFWRDFRKVVKESKPDAYILGEIWHDSLPWLQGDQFDAVMNYPFTTSVVDFFAKKEITPIQFANSITGLLHMYPQHVNEVAFNLLDSHDTARILTLSNGEEERVRLMYVFQFSFIGTPCIYYGDEIGMTGGDDPACRACMEWDVSKQNRDLFQFIQQLIRMRKEVSAFGNQGSFRFIQVIDEQNVIVYEKKNDEQRLIFVLNNGNKVQNVYVEALAGLKTKELFTNEQVMFNEQSVVNLQSYEFVCFQIKHNIV